MPLFWILIRGFLLQLPPCWTESWHLDCNLCLLTKGLLANTRCLLATTETHMHHKNGMLPQILDEALFASETLSVRPGPNVDYVSICLYHISTLVMDCYFVFYVMSFISAQKFYLLTMFIVCIQAISWVLIIFNYEVNSILKVIF